MKKNYNNNNIFDLVPINVKCFNISQFKLILKYYCLFNNDSPYLIHILDCNKNSLDWSREFELYFSTPLDVYNQDFDLSANMLRNDIMRACTEWANKFAHSLPNPNLYYLEITDYPNYSF